jgi:glycerol-3-phosphate acyltransferase PlsY
MPSNSSLDALLHNSFYGNYEIRIAAAIIFAFGFASIPVATIVRWLFSGFDPRLVRSANAFVPIFDGIKGFMPTIVALHGGGLGIGLAAALATTLGHYYTPWLRFRGGRQVDCETGVLLALSPLSALIFVVFWCTAAVTSRSAAIGALFACALLFLPLWFFLGPQAALFGIAAGTAIALRVGSQGQSLERRQVHDLDRAGAARRDHTPALQLE